jgi:hypothetical protein
MPVADPPPPPMVPQGAAAQQYALPPPQAQPGAYPYPPPGYPPYPPYPPPGYQAPPGYPPPPGPEQAASVAAPEPAPAPEPEPEPTPEPVIKDEIEFPEMDDAIDEDPMADLDVSNDEDDDLSSDDIDAMFGDEAEPEPLSSMVAGTAEDDDDDNDDGNNDNADFDDLDEPEPIPQVFTADDDDDEFDDDDEDEDEDKGRGPLIKIIIAVILVFLIGMAGAIVFLRDVITDIVPAAEGIYSVIGLEDDSLGAGLSIKNVKSARESIGGKDVLVVRGEIANVSDRERSIPLLELRLLDLEATLVQSAQATPLKQSLVAGDKIGFKIQLEEPSALAQGLEITFVERADKPAQ